MTNEEAIEWIKGLSDGWDDITNTTACNMAIQALEQESILDKIRAEIDSALSEELPNDVRTQISDVGIGLEIALQIIDKHRKEAEA